MDAEERRFSARLEAGRGGGAYVIVPDHVVAALGGKSRMRVTGTLGGVSFESSTMAIGGGRICLGAETIERIRA